MHTKSTDLQTLRALNARFIHNYVTNDVVSHNALLHPRFVYIGTAGQSVDRAIYLRNWATGFDPEVIVYWDYRDERIDLFGDSALVRATNKHILREAGQELTGMTSYTDTYVREGGQWLCVQAQLNTVAREFWPEDAVVVRRYIKGQLCDEGTLHD
jgi:hypothetical protein